MLMYTDYFAAQIYMLHCYKNAFENVMIFKVLEIHHAFSSNENSILDVQYCLTQ